MHEASFDIKFLNPSNCWTNIFSFMCNKNPYYAALLFYVTVQIAKQSAYNAMPSFGGGCVFPNPVPYLSKLISFAKSFLYAIMYNLFSSQKFA